LPDGAGLDTGVAGFLIYAHMTEGLIRPTQRFKMIAFRFIIRILIRIGGSHAQETHHHGRRGGL